MNYIMTLLTQRQEELEQKLLATVSMAEKASIVLELSHVRYAITEQEND